MNWIWKKSHKVEDGLSFAALKPKESPKWKAKGIAYAPRNDWTRAEIQALYQQPFLDLVFQAQQIHRQYFEANAIQVSTLLSIKTGKCPEDCKYCSQSARYDSKLEAEKRIAVEKVISEAQQAKASGSTRFCMGAAWRNPHERDMPYVLDMVREVKALGLETCMTLGMLNASQAERLKGAGLDY